MTGTTSNDSRQLPPLLAHLVEITKQAGETKYAAVLSEFGHLAVNYVTVRDVMPGLAHVNEGATHRIVHGVASRHLGLGHLEWRLEGAIVRAAAQDERDALHAALADVHTVRDTTHILWGLSIGVALCDYAERIRR